MKSIIENTSYETERGKPMPSKNHGLVQGNLYFALRLHYGSAYKIVPEISLVINGKEKVPDLAVFSQLEFTPNQDEVKVTDLPLCAIEILSPQQKLTDLLVKSHIYFNAGIASYWLIIPALKTIYVFSGIGEYEVFAKSGQVIDRQLNIELELNDIFS